jgi:hypothetical protein
MSLTLNADTLTRSLRRAGHSVASVQEIAPGAVRVNAQLGAAGREAAIRRLAAELLQRGYDAAINASRTAVTVTLPEPVEVESVEVLPTGEVVCPACGAAVAVTIDDNGVTTECGGKGEGSCDEAFEGTERTMNAHAAAVAASVAGLVADEYLVTAARNREADLAEFVAEAHDDPAGIAYEWLATATDLGIPTGDEADPRTIGAALFTAAQKWVADLTVEQLERVLYRHGVEVEFTEAAGKPKLDGIRFTVTSELLTDNTGTEPRRYVWLTVTDDLGLAPSRRRTRSAHVTEIARA